MTATPYVEKLAAEEVLRCPRCRGPLAPEDGALVCRDNGHRFPTHNGVADLYGLQAKAEAGAGSDAPVTPEVGSLVDRLLDVLDLPTDEAMHDKVEGVLARCQLEAGTSALTAEVQDLVDRFGLGDSAGPEAPRPREQESVRQKLRAFPSRMKALSQMAARVERHYLPATLPAGARVLANVRIANTGRRDLLAGRWPKAAVGAVWLDAGGAPLPSGRTDAGVPVDIVPGRSVTVPVPLEVPATPGRYQLVVGPTIQGKWRPAADCAVVTIEVTTGIAGEPPLPLLDGDLPYADDHADALDLLRAAVKERRGALDGIRCVEVGGATSPQLAWLGEPELLNIDIGLPLLELGNLYYEHHHGDRAVERLAFVCADATSIPVEPGRFDVAGMFATLHHFPAPEALLAECRRVVADDGLVAVLCEPCGGSITAPEVLRDLRKGINEQIFSLDEYLRLFAAAGLQVVGGNKQGDSLRAVLAPAPPSGERFDDVERPATVPAPSGLRASWSALVSALGDRA